MNALDRSLVAALDEVARARHLLVACDYDGTLAPIVDDPNRAVPLPEAIDALRRLAGLPNTTVAVVSSRALRDLATLSRLPSEVMLVGSHGLEFDVTFEENLKGQLHQRKAKLLTDLQTLIKDASGVRLEVKPAGVAVHTRMADQATADRIEKSVRTAYGVSRDIYLTVGKKVFDLAVVPRQKQVAVGGLRERFGADAVLFLGDDTADEDVFRSMRKTDVSIKVGVDPESDADYQIENPAATVAVLKAVRQTREHWISGEPAVPIERHAMLANGQTVALLTPDARVTWFCHPRPDSPPVFADLLGGPSAGHFTITPLNRHSQPVGEESLQGQRYLDASMTVETRWADLTVTDWLDTRPEGESNVTTSLVRVLEGTARARIEFAPKPNFGLTTATLTAMPDGLHIAAGAEPSVLRSPGVDWSIVDDVATAVVDLATTGTLTLELRCGSNDFSEHESTVQEWMSAAQQPWQDWASKLSLPVLAQEEVLRSALTLRGLWHQPTGAFLAAATTSLPEAIGANRNWDYRYCWLRDATMSARELVKLGSLEEAEALLGWIDRCVARTGGHPERLHPLYTLDGTDLGLEGEITTVPGYRGSRPVRVGNLADGQIQLDVFGPVADLVAAVVETRAATSLGDRPVVFDHEWQLILAMVNAVTLSWHDPDNGIWEARQKARHHTHSKVMCWWTVARALDVAAVARRPETDVEGWAELAEQIRNDVLKKGWNDGISSFTEAYENEELDAATLWVGLSGMVPDDDHRFQQTVRAIERHLRLGPTVYRYKWDDGQLGVEGGFHICTTWLIEAYLRTGRHVEAKTLFKQYLEMLGPTGLMPEMYDAKQKISLGNHPQAYSHLGLIRCATLFDQSPERSARPIPAPAKARETVSALT